MVSTKELHPQLDNSKISRLVTKACKMLIDTNGKVGSVINFQAHNSQVTTKLWGFNSSRTGLVVEVAIDGVVIDKVPYERPHGGDLFTQKYNCNFAYLYKLRTGQQVAK